MAALRVLTKTKPARERQSRAGRYVFASPSPKATSNMNLVHPPAQQGNVYYPFFRKPAHRVAESATFDSLTAAMVLHRFRSGTLDEAVFLALIASAGLRP